MFLISENFPHQIMMHQHTSSLLTIQVLIDANKKIKIFIDSLPDMRV